MISAYIGLGSNLDNPLQQLRRALLALQLLPRSRLGQVSSAYRSAAVGPGKQPDYLNAVVQLDTTLPAADLLSALHQIEQIQGRVRTEHWGARSLDLDLLLYGDVLVDSPQLSIPHPRLQQRNFVVYPLAEVANSNLVLPDGTDLDTLVERCPWGNLVKTDLQLTIKTNTAPGTQ